MNLSNSVRARFIKDFKLPIQLFREHNGVDYFKYFTDLYNNQFSINCKLNLLESAIQSLGAEENFVNEINNTRDKIIETIKNTAQYEQFCKINMNNFSVKKNKYSKTDIFKPYNNNRYFLSIDLVKANFQVMKKFDCVFQSNSYEELVKKFTDNENFYNYFVKSKYERQIIFGNLNPSRQVTIEQFYTRNIFDWLIENKIFEEKQVRVLTYDEIVIETDSFPQDLSNKIFNATGLIVTTNLFKIKYYEDPINFYVKELKDKIEFKSVPIVFFAQVYKKYYDLPLNNYDLRFLYEKKVAQFVL